jgi:hypothetical protein
VTVVKRIPHAMSPDNINTVLFVTEATLPVVIAQVEQNDDRKPPCGRILSCPEDIRHGKLILTGVDSSIFSVDDIGRLVLMTIHTDGPPGRDTYCRGTVVKLKYRPPAREKASADEQIPGSAMLLPIEVTKAKSLNTLDHLPREFEQLALSSLDTYMKAIAVGMPRPGAPFEAKDRAAYLEQCTKTYSIVPLQKGMATHRIERLDAQAMTQVDWLFLQRRLNYTCDKPPRLVKSGQEHAYVVTQNKT